MESIEQNQSNIKEISVANISIEDYKTECLAHMAENGLPLKSELIVDGHWHHYNATGHKNAAETYIAEEGITSTGKRYLICTYKSFRENLRFTYRSYEKSKTDFSPQEREEFYKQYQEHKAKRETESAILANDAAVEAQKEWDKAAKKAPNGDYLIYCGNKKIEPLGVRFGLNPYGYPSLILRIENVKNETRGLQYISAQRKSNQIDAQITGCFFRLGELIDGKPIYLAEGYGTCITVHTATGECTLSTNGAGNLEAVMAALAQKYPKSPKIIAADNDATGLRFANDVAKKFNCSIAIPVFPAGREKTFNDAYKDFNDLGQACGINEVKAQLAQAQKKKSLEEVLKDQIANLLKEEDPCESFAISYLPPNLASYIESVCEQVEKIRPVHPLMVTNSVMGMISGRIGKHFYYCSAHNEKLYCNLWTLTIGASSSGKSLSLRMGAYLAYEKQANIHRIMRSLEETIEGGTQEERAKIEGQILRESLKNYVLPNQYSAEGFLEHMAQGHAGVILCGEIGPWLQNLDKQYNQDLKGLFTLFYDVSVTHSYKKTGGLKKTITICEPYISICAYSTPPWVKNNLKPDDVASGFFSRFLLFKIIALAANDENTELPQYSYNTDNEIYMRHMLDNIPGSREYRFTPEAWALHQSAKKKITAIVESYDEKSREILEPFAGRWKPGLTKVAMIMQYFYDPSTNLIGKQAVISALSWVYPAILSTIYLYQNELGETKFQEQCRRLRKYIVGKLKDKMRADKASYVTGAEIRGSRVLDTGKEYDDVLNFLENSGKLECKKIDSYQKKSWQYTLTIDDSGGE